MKTILLWDPRFPARSPARLTLPDDIASACVRAGVAASADPSLQSALAAGIGLSPAAPVEVQLQHGNVPKLARVILPLSVAQLAIAAGIAAPIGGSIVVLNLPANVILGDDGLPLITENDAYILTE
jgi:hypothetical protein